MKKQANNNSQGILNYILLVLIFAGIIAVGSWLYKNEAKINLEANLKVLHDKADLLYSQIINSDLKSWLNDKPVGEVGHAAFLSLSGGKSRARVYKGTGKTLDEAYNNAVKAVEAGLDAWPENIKWLKADIAFDSRAINAKDLKREVKAARHEFYRNSLAFDKDFKLALLEAELNGAKIYEYKDGGIDLDYLNNYLRKSARSKLKALPENYILFNTRGWLCDENNKVYSLIYDGLNYGRRDVKVDNQFARELITKSGEFLLTQLNTDGSFIYGMYPRFDNNIKSYNILRHAGTTWALCLNYRINPSPKLKQAIESALKYLASQVVYKDNNTAYVNEAKAGELKLGGIGIAVLAFTEYMDLFNNKDYLELCDKLGSGIFSMMDLESGKFVHVLNNKNFELKDAYRTVYYDGEATFALVRLYSLTKNQKYLDAALKSVNNFIANNYIKYRDHWIAYSLNELLKYNNDPKIYNFALENAFANLREIERRDTTYHTYLELLMAAFEVYDRMLDASLAELNKFNVKDLLNAIKARVDRQLNGYFFPEYAMYMARPDKILDTFMVRHDGYRVRIDDVQHNIGGYYLYYKNYDKLVKHGLN
ncbi:MAG: hypothetical protein II948_02625 [Synergistaceae bacterium]|nr:hypothetical protein [Synergistaceae bacterium]MBQ9582505.1 hypothetical protein [Synergistaceae bacterium]MBR0096232.1 hypothetical protein [Synergistaceae bacterium]